MATEQAFQTRADRDAALSRAIVARLEAAVAERGAATLVATGGSTPAPLYDLLSKAQAPWDKVTVTLSDERWVDPADKASNERLAREHLLVGAAAPATFIGFKTADAHPESGAAEIDRRLRALPRPFDIVILGMGPDGHFASLFPGATELAAGLDPETPSLVIPVERQDAAGAAERLSLTLTAVLDAGLIVILIDGEEKRALCRRAEGGNDTSELPIRAVLNQSLTPVEIWWAP